MAKLRVLYIVHNHPALHPGGTEIVAHELFRAMQAESDVEAMFLGCAMAQQRDPKPGTRFQTPGRSADEILLWTGHFDRFFLSQLDLGGVVPDLEGLLTSFRPDVVHVHHALMIGVEMLFLVRRVLPEAKIVFTLHDYYPICYRDGTMLKTPDDTLCHRATHDACHGCFPSADAWKFSLRERHIKGMLSLVDRFVAPSHFLKQRYVAWGLEAERITVLPNGRAPVEPTPPRPLPKGGRRNVFGFFGHINLYKGANVLLDAADALVRAGRHDFAVHLHGGMLFQTDDFKERFEAKLKGLAGVVSWHGLYDATRVPDLIRKVDWVIMPSIWWENAPLVIEEAFAHKRPVICSDIGGMAERVADGVNGLHFTAGSVPALAATLARALDEPELWGELQARIPATVSVAESVRRHRALYEDTASAEHQDVLDPRRAGKAAAAVE